MGDKQEDIKQAAITLFARRGFDGTTVPLVAEEASVGAGTIYRYFENKEVLLNVIMQDEMFRLEESLKAKFPFEKTTREQFSHLFITLIRYSQENFDALMLINSHTTSRHITDKTKCDYTSLLTFVSTIVEAGREQEMIDRDLPIEAIVAITFGAVVELAKCFNGGELLLTDALLKTLDEKLWRAISR
ncbi:MULTISPECIES: TetR/AcrR family transcriptional regulator [Shouchella]|uniref:TetR/AcrR family transcriptional regulator n=1 Tax=Shouchella hunanensis TaxID=766894 RepID=A0ABY7W6Z2_9BACI|nr:MULTISPECIES: TetR/AcrR family transcriptional regulator [Shouchella]WDF03281.1 TetR/AcrR family transcriptional regulator [Shouchella hunanensis]GAF24017.1 transcription regulator multidrug efflux pump operon [Bacillus sp. JCM 19047]